MAKKILEEGTVRRFMKIAGLQPLSESFVDALEEEAVEEGYKEEEAGMEPMKEEAEEGEEMEPAGEMEMAPEAGEEEVEVGMGDEGGMSEQDKVDLLQKLAQALGVDVEVESDEGEGEGMEMGGEAPEGEMAPEAGEEEEVMEEGEHMDGEDKAKPDGTQAPDNKDMKPLKTAKGHMAESREAFKNRIVEQVAKRVAARLKDLK
jgi:hypothetical protein